MYGRPMWNIAAIILEKRWVLAKMHFVSPHIIASLLSYIAYKSSSYSEKNGNDPSLDETFPHRTYIEMKKLSRI